MNYAKIFIRVATLTLIFTIKPAKGLYAPSKNELERHCLLRYQRTVATLHHLNASLTPESALLLQQFSSPQTFDKTQETYITLIPLLMIAQAVPYIHTNKN